ncbi:hypothetical protein FisN_17Hh090 [Fistulifera solaris]|uniref:Arrestin C-terminal-like domain-containing protein n=1 Tax=Fistulifera solaris TaxID=1519565 RepID=A0A1Z5JGN3_FISSO|nr:hypothetical protein FisN_17Hh090 [Fistulifera solaris]|eukprot:GAX13160.1 hypothetical protein FisN_17Hh090 [Fistulifera solaris]
MGNKHCKVVLRIDEPERIHQAGDRLSGRIYLNACNKADLTKLQDIHLVLEGVEYVEISQSKKAHRRRKKECLDDDLPIIERESKVLLHKVHSVVQLDGKLRPGQYEYPFHLWLPNELPSSMPRIRSRKRNFAEIRYSLTVKVSHVESVSSAPQLSDKRTIHIAAQALPQGAPIVTRPEIYPVKMCSFFRRGCIQLGWETPSDVCAAGGTLPVIVSGFNQSSLNVLKISVKLIETVEFFTSKENLRKVVSRLVATEKLSTEELSWWRPRYKPSTDESSGTPQPQVIQLFVPYDVRDSYSGTLIKVKHSIVVLVEMDGGFFSTTPESAVRVKVRRALKSDDETTQIPISYPMNPDYQDDSSPSNDNSDTSSDCSLSDWHPHVAEEVIAVPMVSAVLIDEGCAQNNSLPIAAAAIAPPVVAPSAPREIPSRMVNHSAASPSVSQLHSMIETRPENLQALLSDTVWSDLVRGLTPRDYCTSIQKAGQSGPSVAFTLAQSMGCSFTTRHVLASIYGLSDSTIRMDVVLSTASLAKDILQNRGSIERELTSEELSSFRAVLA